MRPLKTYCPSRLTTNLNDRIFFFVTKSFNFVSLYNDDQSISSAVICFIGIESKIYAKHSLQTFTCSMSIIETLEKDVKFVLSQQYRNQKETGMTSMRLFCIFIVDFERISYLFLDFLLFTWSMYVFFWFLGFTFIVKTATYYALKHLLTLSWRRSLLYRNQSIDLQSKSMVSIWFSGLYMIGTAVFKELKEILWSGQHILGNSANVKFN